MLLLSACSEEQRQTSGTDEGRVAPDSQTEPPPRPVHPAADCPLEVTSAGQAAWQAVGDRLAAGEEVPAATFTELCAQPDYALWLETIDKKLANPHIFQNVMAHVFAPAGEPIAGQRRRPKRQDLIANFSYVRDRADSLASFLASYESARTGCRIFDLVEGFIRPARLPGSLTISFLTLSPEIRLRQNRVLVDSGLAIAAGPERLNQLLASVLYRDLEAPPGPLPHAATGQAALVATMDRLRFEGISAWLEDLPDLAFDPDHPELGRPPEGRADFHSQAAHALQSSLDYLEILLDDPDQMRRKGQLIDEVLRGLGAYRTLGYAMAAQIAERLGENRLRAGSRDPISFLRAYQESARLTGESSGDRSRLTVIPEDDFQKLLSVLRSAAGP